MSRFDAVIVGGGPRGVATVLRTVARLRDRAGSDHGAPPAAPLRLALVDALAVGSGATWWINQPAAYLNNTQARATTIHPDASTPMSGPPAPGPDLVEWARAVTERGTHPVGEWVVAEARQLAPHSFPSRRLQGVYFCDQLDDAVEGGLVTVDRIVSTAVDLENEGVDRVVVLADGRRLTAPTVVLAQGMVQSVPGPEETQLAEAARRHGLRYVPPGMPAERHFTDLPPGEDVLVRGLGANFFDVIGQLAAQWGGQLETVPGDPTGRLRYVPSGREPRLVVGSCRCIPYRSKPDSGQPTRTFTPRWATREWFADLARSTDIDLRAQAWPQIAKEFARVYLEALQETAPAAVAGDWLTALDAATDAAAVDDVLRAAITDPRWTWTVQELHQPTCGRTVTPQQWDALVDRLIEDELGSMSAPGRHPRAAVNGAMGTLRGQVAFLARSGAFSGRSLARDVMGWFDADGLALASGPPADRVRLVLALIEAGVIDLLGPEFEIRVEEQPGDEGRPCFVAHSPVTSRSVSSRVLLETRMSKGKVLATSDSLLRALLDSGRARIHEVDGVPTTSMEATGADRVEHVIAGHNLVAADGTVDPAVVVIGIPALSTQPGSAIGASPNVPSPLLAGADVAAKQIVARAEGARRGLVRHTLPLALSP